MTDQSQSVTGQAILINGESFYQISNTHQMPEFFMSLVGSSNHWMFISSLGALTAGRCDPDHALFPYAADDQISAARHTTGPYTRIVVHASCAGSEGALQWEPFLSTKSHQAIKRNLYKSQLGNQIIFEEIHAEVGLSFQYRWAYSEKHGFIRSCELTNHHNDKIELDLIDGIQNLVPSGLGSEFTMRFSNLGNAYKKSERLSESDLGIFYLSSVPTDRAEPNEGLKATAVWHTGLDPDFILLSTDQLQIRDRCGDHVYDFTNEYDVRGKQQAYLIGKRLHLPEKSSVRWHIVADVNQDHSALIALDSWLQETPHIESSLQHDIKLGQEQLRKIIGSADGFQCGENLRRIDRHIANTTFNLMRGGVPLNNYRIPRKDFSQHVRIFNRDVADQYQSFFEALPETIEATELQKQVAETSDVDLIRLTQEYLPLAFSRRHGDPTRPWNRFAIHLKTDSGEPNLTYQGNWRDLFQNWEALAISFPDFGSAMINRFLNATTADGYNPYRVTKEGFEWEAPTPEDPWANIGYWGDHQIIYLLKLLEANRKINPAQLDKQLTQETFVHANVPYRIKDLEAIKLDPRDTIEFDDQLAKTIDLRIEQLGADGKLLRNQIDEIHRVSMLEKLLTLTLAKLSNFVPDGGIWLNTQRPEWNDANNALVGNGLSVVTTCYLYRWCAFMEHWLEEWSQKEGETDFYISVEVLEFFDAIFATLSQQQLSSELTSIEEMSAETRSKMVTELGNAGSIYRNQLYTFGPTGQSGLLSSQRCKEFFLSAKQHLARTILCNRREDKLFHSYNLLRWSHDEIHIDHLDEMLEGQVAVLSAGILNASTTADLLDALRASRLYRENQKSYLLYPNKQLPRFLSKNQIPSQVLDSSQLMQRLIAAKDQSIIKQDVNGGYHFNGSIRNANDLAKRLSELPNDFQDEVKTEFDTITNSYIDLFDHRQFTGRSGTFFGYEGLGSIYWHMVSKLGLAVAENYFQAVDEEAPTEVLEKLRLQYYAIRAGIGSEKTPLQYGAFPSDPYSHTPENAGVKQPGMTGQVKEDVLARFMETGVIVADGCIHFRLGLFDQNERLRSDTQFTFTRVDGSNDHYTIPAGGFGFTYCQVPIIYQAGKLDRHRVTYADGTSETFEGLTVSRSNSHKIFSRSMEILSIECECAEFETSLQS